MIDSKLTVKYTFMQGSYWMGYAVISSFASVYLLDAGFTSGQVGILIAVAGLLSAVLQPLMGSLADKKHGPSLKFLVLTMAAILLACGVGLILVRGQKAVTCLIYCGAIMILQTVTSLLNAIAMIGERKPNYGLARGLASIAYAGIAMGLGYLVDAFGVLTVPVVIVIAYTLMLAVTVTYPRMRKSEETAESSSGSPVAFFRKYPRFGAVLVGCVLVFISHSMLNNFTFQIAVSKGGGSSEMGLAICLAALIEIPTMLIFIKMLKIAKCHVWFRICGIFFLLKNLFTMLCTTIPGFYAAQIFQLLAWGVIAVASVYYINAIMAPEDAVKGQSYYTVSFTLGSVFGALVGGWLIDAMGVNVMLAFGTGCALAGAVMLLIFTQKTEI